MEPGLFKYHATGYAKNAPCAIYIYTCIVELGVQLLPSGASCHLTWKSETCLSVSHGFKTCEFKSIFETGITINKNVLNVLLIVKERN